MDVFKLAVNLFTTICSSGVKGITLVVTVGLRNSINKSETSSKNC